MSQPDQSTIFFVFQSEQLILLASDHFELPHEPYLTLLRQAMVREKMITLQEGNEIYAIEIDEKLILPPPLKSVSLRSALQQCEPTTTQAIVKAFSVLRWDRNHQFCGQCGHATEHRVITFERVCSNCHLSVYPRISPSVIVLIHKEDELVMARSPHFPAGVFGMIAGFVEAGESLEEAAHREVKEEVGLTIKQLRYFGSQPWPFPDSLMVAFFAEYHSGEIIIDTNEIETAGWFHYQKLPGRPSTKLSIGSHLLDAFIDERNKIKNK